MRSSIQENWSQVIFSDENKFELRPRRRECGRRPVGKIEKYDHKYTMKTIKFEGGSIMVCGCIRYGGLHKIVSIRGTLDAPKCVDFEVTSSFPWTG